MSLPPDQVRMDAGLITIMQQGRGPVGLATITTLLERYTAYYLTL